MRKEDMVIFSVDDHIVEAPHIFDQHLPLIYKDRAPKCRETDNGEFNWEFEGKFTINFALNAVAGRPKEELGFEPNSFDHIRKGCYDPVARIDDMNVNGIFAGVNFPTFPGFALELFQVHKDRKLALALIQAYNDWHIDEWCATAPDRFIPIVGLPLFDVDEAVKELKRGIAKGARTATFPTLPQQLGFPTIHDPYWAPLWKVANDEGFPLSIHVSALSGTGSEHISADSPVASFLNKCHMSAMAAFSEWLWSDPIQDYPDLKIILSEGGIGWLPYFLERAEQVEHNHGPWMGHVWKDGKRPTDVYREHFISSFIQDERGVEMRHQIGIDTITFENDYPHADITWPNTPEQLWSGEFKDGAIGQEDIDKITFRNAAREYRWDAVERLGRENCNVAMLRELGKSVDLTPITGGGVPPRDHDGVVRASDIMKLFPKNLMDPLEDERSSAA
ncbi:amidohydrolase family protein [Sphingopyxis sp.]|jgi:predicted TIM-barrel fold metal-dependent hydrolase|uniref:amidohydrolase family protein n=1 Tax=Sphingopyxis sp. TaxID=1908224 RepID=UPI003F7068F5